MPILRTSRGGVWQPSRPVYPTEADINIGGSLVLSNGSLHGFFRRNRYQATLNTNGYAYVKGTLATQLISNAFYSRLPGGISLSSQIISHNLREKTTLLAYCNCPNVGGSSGVRGVVGYIGASSKFVLHYSASVSEGIMGFLLMNSYVTGIELTVGGSSLPDPERLALWRVDFDGTTARILRDGTVLASGNPVISGVPTFQSMSFMHSTVNYTALCNIAFAVGYRTLLPDDYGVENPWQIFKKPSRVLYFPVSSAGYYDEYLSLSAVLSQEQSRTADYSAGLSLTAAAGAMSGPNTTMNSALTLPTVAAVEPGTTAVMNPSLALDLRALLSSSGTGVYARALELSATLGAVVGWDTSIEAALDLAMALALSDSALRTVDATLPLGVMIDALSAAVATMSDTLSLGLSAGQTLSGGLDLSAELSLTWSLAMTATGATWEITTTMPNGRVITVTASERIVTIAASDRTITVH